MVTAREVGNPEPPVGPQHVSDHSVQQALAIVELRLPSVQEMLDALDLLGRIRVGRQQSPLQLIASNAKGGAKFVDVIDQIAGINPDAGERAGPELGADCAPASE
jgi:hypothetical protein